MRDDIPFYDIIIAMRRRTRRKLKKSMKIGIVFLCALFVFVMWLIPYHRRKVLEEESQLISFEYEWPTHKYDWDNLKKDGTRYSYQDDNYTSLTGIDVSSHQGTIDWEKTGKDNIDFAMIRCGYRGAADGTINEDEQFEANIKGAQANDIRTGVYFFSQAVSVEEAAEEADYVISKVKNYKLDMPVVFDLEEMADGSGRTTSLSAEERTRMAVTFMNRVEDAGYTPMVYNSSSLLSSRYDLEYLQPYMVWAAEYGTEYPSFPYEFEMWQYTNEGQAAGINTNVDMDLWFVKKDAE